MPSQPNAHGLVWLGDYAIDYLSEKERRSAWHGLFERAQVRIALAPGALPIEPSHKQPAEAGDGAGGTDVGSRRYLRDSRRTAIKADIGANLHDWRLSIAAVAARQRVTQRYVQKLFQDEGTTFTQFVLASRLDRARRMLSDPRLARRSITSIAFEIGFGDLSYFNRTFRRRFGETPSAVRVAA